MNQRKLINTKYTIVYNGYLKIKLSITSELYDPSSIFTNHLEYIFNIDNIIWNIDNISKIFWNFVLFNEQSYTNLFISISQAAQLIFKNSIWQFRDFLKKI